MYSFLITVTFICAVLYEWKTFRFQRWGVPAWAYMYNIVFFSALYGVADWAVTNATERGLDNLSEIEQILHLFGGVLTTGIPPTIAAIFGCGAMHFCVVSADSSTRAIKCDHR